MSFIRSGPRGKFEHYLADILPLRAGRGKCVCVCWVECCLDLMMTNKEKPVDGVGRVKPSRGQGAQK